MNVRVTLAWYNRKSTVTTQLTLCEEPQLHQSCLPLPAAQSSLAATQAMHGERLWAAQCGGSHLTAPSRSCGAVGGRCHAPRVSI